MRADSLKPAEVAAALLRCATTTYQVRAAMQLLVDDGHWIRDTGFLRAVDVEIVCGVLYAVVDWIEVVRLASIRPATESQRAVLRVACSLAGQAGQDGEVWSLRGMLTPLDGLSIGLVITAVASAAAGSRL